MVYLDPQEHRKLRQEARALGISMAELVRRLVHEYLLGNSGAAPVPRGTFLKIVALGKSGRRDVSEQHDRYLGEALRREHQG